MLRVLFLVLFLLPLKGFSQTPLNDLNYRLLKETELKRFQQLKQEKAQKQITIEQEQASQSDAFKRNMQIMNEKMAAETKKRQEEIDAAGLKWKKQNAKAAPMMKRMNQCAPDSPEMQSMYEAMVLVVTDEQCSNSQLASLSSDPLPASDPCFPIKLTDTVKTTLEVQGYDTDQLPSVSKKITWEYASGSPAVLAKKLKDQLISEGYCESLTTQVQKKFINGTIK